MPLVPAICTQCGAQIEVDDTHEAGVCKHCGTAFITEKAINNYNTNITNNIVNNNNFAGANVSIQGDNENIEKLMERAETFDKLNDFSKSLEVYKEITSKYPMDYRGWIGIVAATTKDYTNISCSDFFHKEIIENFEKAIKVSKQEYHEGILQQKQKYEDLYKKEVTKKEDGEYIASVCNLYRYSDIKQAIGCDITSDAGPYSSSYVFDRFTFVLGNKVECWVYYKVLTGIQNGQGQYRNEFKDIKITCRNHVTKNNIEELLSGYKKKSEQSTSSGGCYIATCVYGSYDCPQVWTLRRFRDYTLDKTWYGRTFIKCYYAISPTLVKWFGNQKWFRTFWKNRLDSMVVNLNQKGIENTQYHDKY